MHTVSAEELTFFELIDNAAEQGLLYVGSGNHQKVSHDIPKDFDSRLSADEMRQIRLKLDAAGVRLLVYRAEHKPSTEADRQRIIEFARIMGCEAIAGKAAGLALEAAPEIVKADGLADAGSTTPLLARVSVSGPLSTIFTIEFGRDGRPTGSGWIQDIEFFNEMSVRLAERGKP